MTQTHRKQRMYVVKRSGDREPVYFDKITVRNEQLCEGLEVDPTPVSQKVVDRLYSGMRTEELDILSAETALYMSTYEPEYEILAKRIIVSNLHKKTTKDFSKVSKRLHEIGLLNKDYYNFIWENSEEIDKMADYDRDYTLTYFGFKTLEKSYLNKDSDGKTILERPQHVWLRVATFLRMPDLEGIKKVYDMLSLKYFTHATPTLFHAGLICSQLSSCFLLSMNDQLEDMLDCMKYAGLISKHSGGIGINISMIRSKGSRIHSTGGKSDGIVPFLKCWNSLARYVNQGGGKRKGSVAVYLEPHHPDIFDFLKIRKNNTKEEEQCLDLHIAMWIPDLFMKRLETGEDWCLFDPNKVKGLQNIYGEEYEKVYLQAEKDRKYEQKIKIHDLWKEILVSQMETGEPYILYKDHVNRKNNQSNMGVIRGSNLCSEICEYTDNEHISVCNLASISLPAFVKGNISNIIPEKEGATITWKIYTKEGCKWCDKAKSFLTQHSNEYEEIEITDKNRDKIMFDLQDDIGEHSTVPIIFLVDEDFNGNPTEMFLGGYTELEKYFNPVIFDYAELGKVIEEVTENMNVVIDKNFYPVEQARTTNMKSRPIGIGVQGLADVLQMMDLAWEDLETEELNRNVYAVMYYFAMKKSVELAKRDGPYPLFKGSPCSEGKLQPDLWGVKDPPTLNGLMDWNWLREQVKTHGVRNSLLITQMPTASTSQIMGNNESFEPYTSNMYVRRVLSGDFPVINQHLYRKLSKLDLWTPKLVRELIKNDGSVQHLDEVPQRVKEVYKTVWELKMKRMIDLSAGRAPYICQTQSLNQFIAEPTMEKLSSMHMYSWKKGLKTGMYYLRRKTKVNAVQFSILEEPESISAEEDEKNEECVMCSA